LGEADDGQLTIDDGRWSVVSSQWSMVGSQWSVALDARRSALFSRLTALSSRLSPLPRTFVLSYSRTNLPSRPFRIPNSAFRISFWLPSPGPGHSPTGPGVSTASCPVPISTWK
jgi:hypothetical protein